MELQPADKWRARHVFFWFCQVELHDSATKLLTCGGENVKSKHSIDLQRKTGSGVLSAQATVLNFRTSTMSVVMQRNRTNMYMQAKQWEPNQIRSEERSGSCDFDVDAYLVLPWSKRGNWLLNFLQSWAVYVMFTTTTVTALCVAYLNWALYSWSRRARDLDRPLQRSHSPCSPSTAGRNPVV